MRSPSLLPLKTCSEPITLWSRTAFVLGVILVATTLGVAELPVFRPNDALTRHGLERFYNMDYELAIADLEKAAAQHPANMALPDPFPINNLANCYLVRELYRMGALDPADYLNDNFIGSPKRPAGAEVSRKIRELLERATDMEEVRLRDKPNDVDMLYARGVTRGIRSSYTGLIERSWFAALRSAVGSRQDHERVLQLSPTFTDAKLIVGAHDYVMGSLPWPVKAAAAVVGFNGSRERGIEELSAAARGGGQASIDAKILLALFLRREGRPDKSIELVRELVQLFPQNIIFAIQEGDMLRAAHRNDDALTTYHHVWDMGRKGRFPIGGYELAAINMGDLQRSLHDDTSALASYNLLQETLQAPPELRQRAFLNCGEIYDMHQKRELAIKNYQAVVAIDGSSEWAQQARKYLKGAYP
jgi:tetratricopeptide (TPR) repeat protein